MSGREPLAELRRDGISRAVLLVGPWAIKIPKSRYGWPNFLRGLLANLQEARFSRAGWPELCPVVFALWGGWLIVQRRARHFTEEEWDRFDAEAFCDRGDYVVPAEAKSSSFGWLDGRAVAVDYGN